MVEQNEILPHLHQPLLTYRRKMLNNKEKAQIIESRIEQINYNIRDNIIQIDDIRSVYPVDEETINAIYFHIDEWTSKKVVLENELNKINIDDNK